VKKKIDKRTREEAALICAIAACELKAHNGGVAAWGVADRIGATRESLNLALDAKVFAIAGRIDDTEWNYEHACAEAEALLRTGWSPS